MAEWRGSKGLTISERLVRLSERDGECLIFTGTKNRKGYGKFGRDGKWVGAHRVAYEAWVGPIPEGLEIDHLCRRTDCIEPTHLEAVTRWVNLMRGTSFSAKQARMTHCKRGHELPDRGANGKRVCKPCQTITRHAREGRLK